MCRGTKPLKTRQSISFKCTQTVQNNFMKQEKKLVLKIYYLKVGQNKKTRKSRTKVGLKLKLAAFLTSGALTFVAA